MAARKYVSTAKVQSLASGITDVQTTMELSATGGFDPTTLPASYPYTLVIDPDLASEEIVTVTSKAGSVYTIAREQDGTSRIAHSAGAVVKHMVTARDLQEPQNHMDASSNVHGLDIAGVGGGSGGAVVGTTAVQTLSNKTLASPTITGTLSAPSGSITSLMIADGTILNTDINAAAAIAPSKIAGTALTAADTGTVTTTILADDSVTSAKIAAGTIVNSDINASAAIDATKIADTAVTLTATQTVSNKTLTAPVLSGTTNATSGTINFGTNTSAITANSLTISATEISYLDGVTSSIQSQIAAISPAGMIVPYAGSSAPTGWLLCWGQTLDSVTNPQYASLFSAIGTQYGGTGAASFMLPDLRGRVIAALDNMGGTDAGRLDWANTLGTAAGEQTHLLTAAESGVPAHTHGVPGAALNAITSANPSASTYVATGTASSQRGTEPVDANTAANASTAHNIMQPTILLNYMIKY